MDLPAYGGQGFIPLKAGLILVFSICEISVKIRGEMVKIKKGLL